MLFGSVQWLCCDIFDVSILSQLTTRGTVTLQKLTVIQLVKSSIGVESLLLCLTLPLGRILNQLNPVYTLTIRNPTFILL